MTKKTLPQLQVAALGVLALGMAGAPLPAVADDSTQLPTVTITAQKRTEDIISVPISAMAIDQETFDKLGVKDVSDIARIVPGLTFQPTDDAGDNNIAIRGIFSNVGAATTGIYIDEVPVMVRQDSGLGSNPYPKVFDLDRLEVLRGPQGTLFGAGAEGGVLRFITPEASLHKTSGFASADVAATEHGDPSYEAGAAIGAPIEEGTLGYRFSVWHRVDGGIGDRVDPVSGAVLASRDNSSESTVAHAAVKYAPTPQLSVTASFFDQLVQHGDIGLFLESAGVYDIASPIRQPLQDKFMLPAVNVDYDFGSFSFRSISSYIDRAQNELYDSTGYLLGSLFQTENVNAFDPNYFASAHYFGGQHGWTQEFRLTSTDQPEDKFTWVTGLFYRHTQMTSSSIYQAANFDGLSNYYENYWYGAGIPLNAPNGSYNAFGEEPLLGSYIYTDAFLQLETDLAAYGDVTYRITPDLKMSVGLRVARSGYKYTDYEDGPWGPAAPFYEAGTQSETPVTPRFNLSEQIDANRMVYASIAKGYRMGGGNEPVPTGANGFGCSADLAQLGLTQVPGAYNSDSLWNYEVGAKGHFFDRRLLVEASAYWINWNNIQESVNLVTCGYNYIANLGKVTSRGVDVQTEWLATKHVKIDATAGLTDVYYRENLIQDGQLLTKQGDRLSTPAITATAGVEYSFTPWDGADGFWRVDYDFNGGYKRYGSIDTFGNDPYANDAPPIRWLDMRVGAKSGPWEASVYGNNLANEQTSTFRYRSCITCGDLKDLRLRPLTVGMSGKYSF